MGTPAVELQLGRLSGGFVLALRAALFARRGFWKRTGRARVLVCPMCCIFIVAPGILQIFEVLLWGRAGYGFSPFFIIKNE